MLSPEDYGLVGLATVYLALMSLLCEFGIGEAVVSFKDIDDSTVAEMNTEAFRIFQLKRTARAIGQPFTEVLATHPDIVRVLHERMDPRRHLDEPEP
jgi:hypothetical protein